MKCKFRIAYTVGDCARQAKVNGYCESHSRESCTSCGRQATHTCDHKLNSRVCHLPLCSRCIHLGDEYDHGPLPNDPTMGGMARDLARNVLGREAPAASTRTVVEDLTQLLEELS